MVGKQNVLRCGVWIAIERFGQQGIQFFVSILLARILEPSEFGLVAMISIFTAFSTALINGGFASALIQKKDTTRTDESTVFWFNLAVSALMTMILWLGAPSIARFYEQPRLVSILRWSSFSLLATGFAVVQLSLLRKEFAFRIRTIASITGVAISGVTSICMALSGYGVWALVAQGIVMNGTMVLMVWILHPWRPVFVFNVSSFKELFRFGSRLFGVGMMNAIYENLYQIIIGRLYTATDLGYFQRGKRFMQLCAYTPVAMITQIHFPYMCKIQDDPEQMRSAFHRTIKYSVMFTMPLLMGLMVVAPNLIVILIGEKWLPSVPYLRIMCFTGALVVIYMLNLDVIKARGDSTKIFKIELFNRALLAISIVVLYRYGICALLYGEFICVLLATTIVVREMRKYIGAGVIVQIGWLAPCVLASAVMLLAAYGVGLAGMGIFGRLTAQILVGICTYTLVLVFLRDKEFLEMLKIDRFGG